MPDETLTATEAVRRFYEILNLVRYQGKSFEIVRGKESVARIVPSCGAPRSVKASELKKLFADTGKAEKLDMIRAAQRRGFKVTNDHEADAAACWLHGVAKAAPQHLHLYDPIFIGGRRG